MPGFYRVLKADPLDGEYTPDMPGAKPIKSYWCQVEGEELPVMMSKQVPNTPSLTEGHYGVLEDKQSAKGTKYKKFTSMQIPQGQRKPQYSETLAQGGTAYAPTADASEVPAWFIPYARAIKEVVEYVREQNAEDTITKPAPAEPTTATEEHVGEPEQAEPPTARDVGSTQTITREELEDIFGGPVEPLEIKE